LSEDAQLEVVCYPFIRYYKKYEPPFYLILKTCSFEPGQSLMALPWSFVSKITNSKHQITKKSQISIFNDQNLSGLTPFSGHTEKLNAIR
jgi:hypothetical protein